MNDIYNNYEFNTILNYIDKFAYRRKIVIWGYGDYQKDLTDFLNENGICVTFYVDDNRAVFDENVKTVTDYINNCSSTDYYLVVTLMYSVKTVNFLNDSKLVPNQDYVYCVHSPVTVTINKNYSDEFGNIVIFEDDVSEYNFEFTITFKGFNSVINIGKNFSSQGSVKMSCDSNCEIKFGDNVRLGEYTLWTVYKNSSINVGNGCVLESGRLHTFRAANITIGDNSAIGRDYFIIAHIYTSISIGCDCCISNDFHIRTNDGHTIFDIEIGESLNVSLENNKKLKMIISDHVWVGTRAVILGDAQIGSGSIIGACSLVKGNIPNNCTAAGVPAKVRRKNIAWCRQNYADDIRLIPEQYVNYTDDSFGY